MRNRNQNLLVNKSLAAWLKSNSLNNSDMLIADLGLKILFYVTI